MWLRALYEIWKAIWGTLAEFGVTGAIIGGTSAFFMTGWASLQRQEWWFLAWVALTTFAAVLSVYVIVRVYIQTWRNLPHYDQWDLVDPLHLWQAAYLWAGKNPAGGAIDRGKEYAYLHAMKAAIDNGRLVTVEPIPESHAMWTRISRDALKKYIETTPERPAFLFKERRR